MKWHDIVDMKGLMSHKQLTQLNRRIPPTVAGHKAVQKRSTARSTKSRSRPKILTEPPSPSESTRAALKALEESRQIWPQKASNTRTHPAPILPQTSSTPVRILSQLLEPFGLAPVVPGPAPLVGPSVVPSATQAAGLVPVLNGSVPIPETATLGGQSKETCKAEKSVIQMDHQYFRPSILSRLVNDSVTSPPVWSNSSWDR